MKIIKTIPFMIFLIPVSVVFGQVTKVKGTIFTDSAELRTINIFPGSFPNVTVVFRAETKAGEPVWNLTKEKMKVLEDAKSCDVISLDQISKIKPINIGIVIDHSGSMNSDQSLIFPFAPNSPVPGSKTPLDNAKGSVKKFIKSFNSGKDLISVIGFSNIVDKKLPLTRDKVKINATVDSMEADFLTALYDAMITGMEEIEKADGINVLVVLTDGYDNLSKSTWKNVIDAANKKSVPVYIIGLGNVNSDTLQLIAQATSGKFYHTQTSSSFDSIYTLISKQIQAFYNLVYVSPNFSSADTTRKIELSFAIDSIFLVSDPATIELPKEVIVYLKNKEKEKQYLIYGAIALVSLIGIGILVFQFKKKAKTNPPIIKNLFPNPNNGKFVLDYESPAGLLKIFDLNGRVIKAVKITGSEKLFELNDLSTGNYVAVIFSSGQQSNPIKFIIEK